MSFEDFQDGRHGDHLEYRYGMIFTILNLLVTPMPSTEFGLNLTSGAGADVVLRFSRWQPNVMILVILNLYVAPMFTIKFRLNPTYDLGGNVV